MHGGTGANLGAPVGWMRCRQRRGCCIVYIGAYNEYGACRAMCVCVSVFEFACVSLCFFAWVRGLFTFIDALSMFCYDFHILNDPFPSPFTRLERATPGEVAVWCVDVGLALRHATLLLLCYCSATTLPDHLVDQRLGQVLFALPHQPFHLVAHLQSQHM